MSFSAVILAAGKGTRMYSDKPKVLHTVAGRPMVKHVIDACVKAGADNLHLIYGHGGDQMKATLANETVNWVLQAEQLGTGHAVDQASPHIKDDESVLIVYGDGPLITPETLSNLVAAQPQGGIALLTVILDDPTGYGRIVRENGKVTAIVEQKDANEAQKSITEVNTGVLVATGKDLKRWLSNLTNNNAQGEYYLTDIISAAYNEGQSIEAIHPQNPVEVEGANDRVQLARLERAYQQIQAEKLLKKGVMLRDPNRFDLRGELEFGMDVEIDVNVIIEGKVILGNNVVIGAGCILKNCQIADNAVISPYSLIDDSQVGENATVGPFARLRPGTELKAKAHVGNFVELKNATLGEGSKSGHLTYLGDTQVGMGTNIGAGTITCNYDGANKHKTIIGDRVFVGSDSQLVAPVYIGDDVTIGAGTTVTKDVEATALITTRVEPRVTVGWEKPTKK